MQTWNIDPTHSSIEFRVRHMGIATVRGRFREFSGAIEVDDVGRLRHIAATIDAGSIDTGVDPRDTHLRSPDFFDAERFPTIEFHSTAIEPGNDGALRVVGDLSMHGVTHQVMFVTEAEPPITDPWGNRRGAASANGTLSRKDWGLTWNQTLEIGGVVVADEIRFTLEVEVVAAEPVSV
jgi:polyisoprenoid-binding protein YceI